jgi:MoaA/NifB/PqqE/SkfB family radical SAM enzyme
MRKTAGIKRQKLSESRVKDIINQCVLNGIDAVSLTGGEPFIEIPETMELLDYARQRGIIYLRSGTNGYMFTHEGQAAGIEKIDSFVKTLAASGIRNFWISMDSADTQTHEAMRGLPGVIGGIEKALPLFHARGLYPAVNLGINRNIAGRPVPPVREAGDEAPFFEAMKAGFDAFFSKAIALGFTMANVCYPMSSGRDGLAEEEAAYGAIAADEVICFSPVELRLIFKALLEIIPCFRDRIRIFTPLSSLYALSREDSLSLFPCLGGIRHFYMDNKGRLYPCGYRGNEDLGEDMSEAVRRTKDLKGFCKKCHWECFRDPAQLFGIARYIIRHPVRGFIQKRIDSLRRVHTQEPACAGEPWGVTKGMYPESKYLVRTTYPAACGGVVDPAMLKLWFKDIAYYIRNDFFNGRKPGRLRGTNGKKEAV